MIKESDHASAASSRKACCGLPEQHFALLVGEARALAHQMFARRIGALYGGARRDCLEPAFQLGEIFEVLPLRLVGNDPGIGRHVRDGIVARKIGRLREPSVQHAVETVRLIDVAVYRIGYLLRRIAREMMVLAGHGAKASHLPEKPFERRKAAAQILGQEFSGYNLTQTVRIESGEVDKIAAISRQATELIQQGIEFTSSAPLYYYTKLTDIKMDLLARASADGKKRAEIIAENAGNSLGKLKKATLGVFQITGKNTDEDYSYGGTFNTSSRNKTGSITIRMEFAVD